MSSDRLLLFLVSMVGCAAFQRGEYWDDTEGAPADASGPAPGSSSAGSSDTGEPQTTDGSASSGSMETDGESGSGAPAGPSFVADILPILRAGCERCHTAAGAASTTAFLLDVDDETAYATTLEFVDLDNPAGSRLLAKTAGLGHTGGVIYDDRTAEYDTILAWIEHGALP